MKNRAVSSGSRVVGQRVVVNSVLVTLLAAGAAFAQTRAPLRPDGPPRRDFIQHRLPPAVATDYIILKFGDAPLASYDGGLEGLPRTRPLSGRLDLASAASDAYLQHLTVQHEIYRGWLLSLGAESGTSPLIVREFSVTFNGVAVQLNGATPARLAEGPGVVDWGYSRLYRPSADAGGDLIDATEVWPRTGGLENAGAGVKVGIIDSGIDQAHAAFACKESIPHSVYFSGRAGGDGARALVTDHGTHVAGTIGGCAVPNGTTGHLAGIAPGAELWDFNVFPGFGRGYEAYSGAALAHDVMAALEQAVVAGVDVINLGLQGRVELSTDFLALAVNSAVDAGVVVAVAAGNTGPGIATIQSPGGAAKALTVGASGGGRLIGVPIVVLARDGSRSYLAASGDFDSFDALPSAPEALVNWADTGGGVTACEPAPDASPVSGRIVLINDGGCSFTAKIRHAQEAGALGVIVYSNSAGPPISMRHDGSGALPNIPALMVSSADGSAILDGLPARATIEASQRDEYFGGADLVAGFSSRGPSPFEFLIKPDVTAPGTNILSSVLHGEFAAFQGTSVAAAHVSGAAAVLRQLHPEWSASDIKSALVNTAAPLLRPDGVPAALLAQGSGRIDVFAASRSPLSVDPVSASFGFWREGPVMGTRELKLRNLSGADLSCTLADTGPAMLALSAYSLDLAPGETANIRLDLDVPPTSGDLRGDFSGEIQITCNDTTLQVPWWVGIDVPDEPGPVALAKDDPTKCADLVVIDFRIIPTFPIEDQNAQIEIDVKNQGTCDSLSFLVQWKSAQFAPTGPTDFIPGLAAGATTTANFQYAFPEAGNFTTVATVDSDNTVEEFNENNNLEIVPVTVLKQGIDLVISDFKVEPAAGVDASIPPLPVQDRLSRVSIKIQNLGNRAAGDFLVRWTPALLVPALQTQVNGLDPGASTTVFFDYTYGTARTVSTTARVDSSFAVSEVDETNNVQSMSLTVEPQLPDLEIRELFFDPVQPVRGIGGTAWIVVRNRGNTAASSFILEWKPTALAAPLARQINGLDVGASTVVMFDYTYQFFGTFPSTATLDRTNQVSELDEDNNTSDLEILVEEDFIDLQIIEMDIRSGPAGFACERDVAYKLEEPILTQGRNVNVCMKIVNNGNAPSNSFVVEWNPDTLGLVTPSLGTLVNQIDTVGPGETVEMPIDYIYNQHGNFRVVAEVDAFNNVDESNEANQLFLENVVVQPAAIDLIISEFVIVPASPIRGSKATARITVKNTGPYPTDAFSVRWKPTGIEAGGGPTVQVPGLNAAGQPDDTVTVEIDSKFLIAGPYTSFAEVDTFNQIIESNENNNVAFRSVEVQPRETTLSIDFDQIKVFDAFEDGLEEEGEWRVVFAVLDPNGKCDITVDFPAPAPNVDIKADGIQCVQFSDDSVENGDNLNTNKVINVTLLESYPLVLAAIALEVDPTSAPEVPGVVVQYWSSADYRGVNDLTVPGTEGECGGGHCYDLTYDVSIVAEPPVLYLTGESGEHTAMKSVIEPDLPIMLPDGLAQLLPITTVLPPELTRNEQEFWDWERYITVFKDGFESGDLTGGAWTAVSP